MRHFFLLLLLLVPHMARAEGVVVTIKPLHSLVANITQGSGIEPSLIVDGAASLHEFSLKPSQVSELYKADIVFYMGAEFEHFMEKIVPQLPANTKKIAIEKLDGLTLLPIRRSGPEEHDDEHGTNDLHLWLSVKNVHLMADAISAALSEKYPAHAALFDANTKKLHAKLDALDTDLTKRMGKLRGKPFTVFHDAYQYFEHSYELSNIGAVVMHVEQAPSAGHMQELRERIKNLKAICIFREPQFDGRVVDNLMQGTKTKSGVLDPEGSLLTAGPDLYFQLMQGIASGLESCLL